MCDCGTRVHADSEQTLSALRASCCAKQSIWPISHSPRRHNNNSAARILAHSDIDLRLKIGENPTTEPATYWTTDLSYDYVKINADYRT